MGTGTWGHRKELARFSPGTLVRVLRGRDRGRLYLVHGVQGDRLLLVDGAAHPLRRPKPKNPRHVAPVGHLADVVWHDGAVRTALRTRERTWQFTAEGREVSGEGRRD